MGVSSSKIRKDQDDKNKKENEEVIKGNEKIDKDEKKEIEKNLKVDEDKEIEQTEKVDKDKEIEQIENVDEDEKEEEERENEENKEPEEKKLTPEETLALLREKTKELELKLNEYYKEIQQISTIIKEKTKKKEEIGVKRYLNKWKNLLSTIETNIGTLNIIEEQKSVIKKALEKKQKDIIKNSMEELKKYCNIYKTKIYPNIDQEEEK